MGGRAGEGAQAGGTQVWERRVFVSGRVGLYALVPGLHTAPATPTTPGSPTGGRHRGGRVWGPVTRQPFKERSKKVVFRGRPCPSPSPSPTPWNQHPGPHTPRHLHCSVPSGICIRSVHLLLNAKLIANSSSSSAAATFPPWTGNSPSYALNFTTMVPVAPGLETSGLETPWKQGGSVECRFGGEAMRTPPRTVAHGYTSHFTCFSTFARHAEKGGGFRGEFGILHTSTKCCHETTLCRGKGLFFCRGHNIIHMQSSIVMTDLRIWASPSPSPME